MNDKEVILERLLANKQYKEYKESEKESTKPLIALIIVFIATSLLMVFNDLFSSASIIIYFFTFLLCKALIINIKECYQEIPVEYGISAVKEIKKIRHHHRHSGYSWTTHYLVKFNDKEIWVQYANSHLDKKETVSIFHVKDSIIIFKETSISSYRIVSNE